MTDVLPVWIPCPWCGEGYFCTVHGKHTDVCTCPPIEEWKTDPYSDPTPHPEYDPGVRRIRSPIRPD